MSKNTKKTRQVSAETRAKISKSCFGRKAWNKGKITREETRKKISDTFKRRGITPKHKFKKGHVAWNRGKPLLPRTKARISRAKRGKPAWNKGIPITPEQKKKLRAGAKRMWRRRRKNAS